MKAITKFFITVGIGVLLTGWIAVSRDLFEQVEPVKIYHILCDSFFVSGFLIFAVGLLIFVSNEGAFDPLIYGVRSFINIFRKREKRQTQTYYDFCTARAEHKFSFGYIVIGGLVFLAISAVMYMLYSQHKTESLSIIGNWLTAL